MVTIMNMIGTAPKSAFHSDGLEIKVPSQNGSSETLAGDNLAQFLAEFLFDRAHLVSDSTILEHRAKIPILTMRNEDPIGLVPKKYDVKKLFNVKNKTSLACGPDTISMRHIQDLFPSIEKFLQKAVDLPIDKFPDIRENYNRLILKDSSEKPPHVPKSFRPIAELDLIPKYSSIKIFGEQLRDQIIPKMSGNQYAMPTKGCQAAISDTFDNICYHIKSGKFVMLAITDQSNAFCVTDHSVAAKIAKGFL